MLTADARFTHRLTQSPDISTSLTVVGGSRMYQECTGIVQSDSRYIGYLVPRPAVKCLVWIVALHASEMWTLMQRQKIRSL